MFTIFDVTCMVWGALYLLCVNAKFHICIVLTHTRIDCTSPRQTKENFGFEALGRCSDEPSKHIVCAVTKGNHYTYV